MLLIESWYNTILGSFREMWLGFTGVIGNLIGALIVIIIGWLVAVAVAQVVTRLIGILKIDQALEKMGARTVLEKAGLKLDTAVFVGWLVKWFLILIAFLAAVDILGLQAVADYLRGILGFIPHLIVAVIILLLGVLLGDLVDRLVVSAIKAAELKSAEALGKIARWSIYILAILMALSELDVATELLITLFTGFVAMVAIAGGLAFGFGGQGLAKELLETVKRDITGKE